MPLALSLERESVARLSLEEVVRGHLSLVWRVLRRAGVAEADCDDLCQEVFCLYADKGTKVRAGAERAFVVAVAVRKASDYRRAAYQRRHRLESSPGDEVQAIGLSPEGAALTKERLRLLDEILEDLPNEFRDVFVLIEIEQLSTKEVAEVLEIPTGTVSSRMHRARERFDMLLRKRMGEEERS